MNTLKVTPVRVKIEEVDPPAEFFHVTVESETRVWKDTFGSGEELMSFLKGMRVKSEMEGKYIPLTFIDVKEIDLEDFLESQKSPD